MIYIKTIFYRNTEVFPITNDVMFKSVFNDQGKEYIRCMLNCFLKLDIKTEKEVINVEIQVVRDKDIEERAMFYGTRLHSQGVLKGKGYKDRRKTIVLLILDFNINDKKEVIQIYNMRNEDYVFTNLLEIVAIELRKLEKQKADEWLLLFTSDKVKELEKVRDSNDMMANIVSKMVNMSEELREALMEVQRDVFERDDYIWERKKEELKAMKEEREKLTKEAIEEGLKQGMQQGMQQAKIDVAKRMKEKEIDIKVIIETTGLSEKEIECI